MELLFLGTGTSYGVPMIGCDCAVCRSDDPRDKRTRASVLVRTGGGNILIDTATELRQQAVANGIGAVDAILYTHCHADHLHGIDDVRRFSGLRRAAVPVYGDARTIAHIRRTYAYIFGDPEFRLGWGIPRLEMSEMTGPRLIAGATVTPVPILHGRETILGYRIGRMAYLTDCSGIPETSFPLLMGLDTLVLDALRPHPHPTHFCIPQAIEAAGRVAARQTFFTHLTHDVPHATVEGELPEGMRLAYDGLVIEIP